ncbi:hypothetical protein [Olivibacter sitiensis]|uniref:hypothetical protein n=1 Tax=Olivibacter sitiensis TaxID=376470 RepID=UPI0012FC4B31|nr:hypothetical protein [Olivibacter sitiensis]
MLAKRLSTGQAGISNIQINTDLQSVIPLFEVGDLTLSVIRRRVRPPVDSLTGNVD